MTQRTAEIVQLPLSQPRRRVVGRAKPVRLSRWQRMRAWLDQPYTTTTGFMVLVFSLIGLMSFIVFSFAFLEIFNNVTLGQSLV
jgi:hypothetical protein